MSTNNITFKANGSVVSNGIEEVSGTFAFKSNYTIQSNSFNETDGPIKIKSDFNVESKEFIERYELNEFSPEIEFIPGQGIHVKNLDMLIGDHSSIDDAEVAVKHSMQACRGGSTRGAGGSELIRYTSSTSCGGSSGNGWLNTGHNDVSFYFDPVTGYIKDSKNIKENESTAYLDQARPSNKDGFQDDPNRLKYRQNHQYIFVGVVLINSTTGEASKTSQNWIIVSNSGLITESNGKIKTCKNNQFSKMNE